MYMCNIRTYVPFGPIHGVLYAQTHVHMYARAYPSIRVLIHTFYVLHVLYVHIRITTYIHVHKLICYTYIVHTVHKSIYACTYVSTYLP